jgi:hypothetical protein
MAGVRNVGENASAKVARLTNISATLLKHRQHQIHIFNVHSKMVDAEWSLCVRFLQFDKCVLPDLHLSRCGLSLSVRVRKSHKPPSRD